MIVSNRLSPVLLLMLLASLAELVATAQEGAPAKALTFRVRKDLPPTHITSAWGDSMLQAVEVRAKAGGPVLQRIPVGETQTIACDLDQDALPPGWLGTLDYNGDGWRDLYLQVAEGTDPTHAILLFDGKTKRFLASKALASIRGLDLSSSGGEVQATGREVVDSFGLVIKEPMQPVKLSISGAALKKGDTVAVLQSGEPQTVVSAEVGERLEQGGGTSEATYTLICTPEPAAEEAIAGIAVVGAINGLTTDADHLASTRIATGPVGNRLYLRICNSGEGMHLTVWSGKPLKGARVWHRYHHLGYEVEPNCTAKDYRE